jgi:hypothetical protein
MGRDRGEWAGLFTVALNWACIYTWRMIMILSEGKALSHLRDVKVVSDTVSYFGDE